MAMINITSKTWKTQDADHQLQLGGWIISTRHREAQGRFLPCLHSGPCPQHQHWCQGKTGFNLSKHWILSQNYLSSRDLQNTSLPSLPFPSCGQAGEYELSSSCMLRDTHIPRATMETAAAEAAEASHIDISFKYIETKFLLERERKMFSLGWQMRGGIC